MFTRFPAVLMLLPRSRVEHTLDGLRVSISRVPSSQLPFVDRQWTLKCVMLTGVEWPLCSILDFVSSRQE